MSRLPAISMDIVKNRRTRLAPQIQGSTLILCANPEFLRNNDMYYEYRQDSNFFYLTGFEEPESVFVFRPGKTPETVLFVRPKDLTRETWDGFRFGPEGAREHFKMDATFTIDQMGSVLPGLLNDSKSVYYTLRKNSDLDQKILDILEDVKASQGRTGKGLLPIVDPSEVIGEMRLIKQPEEIKWMRMACEMTADAHIAAMKFTKPGVSERQIQGVLYHSFYMANSQRVGYNAIVASGASATTLHYVWNDQVCKDGEMILIDAGAEFNFYSGDITRTFPVNGKFSPAQKAVYEKVLYIQKTICNMVKPGIPFEDLQNTTADMITSALIELKLLRGNKDDLIKNKDFRKYYMHGVSHWLGMDVHDAGLYMVNGKSRKLEPGMMFSVEPGIYIRHDDMDAPKEFRGIGIRIEDDVMVTVDGHENMTVKAPKEISEIESLMAR